MHRHRTRGPQYPEDSIDTYTSVVCVPPCTCGHIVSDRKGKGGEEDGRDKDRVSLEQRVVDDLLAWKADQRKRER